MFGLGAAIRIYLAPDATAMRKGFDCLYGLVRDQLLCDPLSGHVFLFSNTQSQVRRNDMPTGCQITRSVEAPSGATLAHPGELGRADSVADVVRAALAIM